MDMHDVSMNDIMSWAFANIDGETPYVVRHGSKPVSTFGVTQNCTAHPNDIPNFFEKTFPCLYPYGCGGVEASRASFIGIRDHIRWCLQYQDRRFRLHEMFPLISFAILQRREAMLSSKMKIRWRDAHVLHSVSLDKLKQAAKEEVMGHPISDSSVRRLKNFIQCSLSQVMGCNEVRRSWRSQIWSTNLKLGPPTLWLTINPSDIHDPIAQVMTGVEIDLDNLLNGAQPDGKQRAKNIADDPYAAAKFFHFMIQTILKTLLGIEVTPFQVSTEMGVLGEVGTYFGVVECQGRGTLHFHCLLWLKNSPSAEDMERYLRMESFRQKIQQYIKANIRAYVPGMESEETVKAIPTRTDIAFSRPPNPDHPNYDHEVGKFEAQLARTEQIHVCKTNRCLKRSIKGGWKCKRRAPFSCQADDFITEDGAWGPKRLYGYVNAWNPDILVNA